MKTESSIVMMCVLLVVGCGDHSSSPGKEKAGGSATPANYVRGALDAGQHAKGTVGAIGLDRAVQLYTIKEGKRPKTLQDLVKKGHLSKMPPAPAGKQYKYNARTGKVSIVPN